MFDDVWSFCPDAELTLAWADAEAITIHIILMYPMFDKLIYYL